MIQKSLFATLVIVGCLTFLPAIVKADGGRGPKKIHGTKPTKPTKPPKPNKGAPFDGGIGLLIAAGAAYTVKKAAETRKGTHR